MAVNLPISDWIEWAKITQYLVADGNATKRIFNSGRLSKNWPPIIRLVRKLVEVAYARNPDDPTLYVTGPYLRSLIYEAAIAVAGGTVCIPAFIVSNPSNQTEDEGDDATFSVVAGGSSPVTYQWQKDGVDISGETNSTLTIENVESGDAGSYRCVVTNDCGTATSTAATLTVNTSLTGSYYYGDDSYVSNLQSGIDDVPYVGTFSIVNGQPLEVTLPEAAEPNKWHVYRYPESQSVKTTWFNTINNNGSIPDAQFWDVETFGGKRYIFSRTAISIDASASPNMTFDE